MTDSSNEEDNHHKDESSSTKADDAKSVIISADGDAVPEPTEEIQGDVMVLPSLDEESQITEFGTDQPEHKMKPINAAILMTVLGVVYGDIGTSPIYAFRATMGVVSNHHADLQRWEIFGIISLIFWALVLIVTVKYVMLVMRADHNGEGGILALMSLAQRVTKNTTGKVALGMVGIAGTCLFFGDGMITPAVSVLSAIEGLEVSLPSVQEFIVPMALIILFGLFCMQSKGTERIGKIFGPVMFLWFSTIGILGLLQVIQHPFVLVALSPYYAVSFVIHHEWMAFLALGSVVLAVTGAEALYADMGHFGRKPIGYAWVFFVLPALTLNYLGQGALVLTNPHALSNPFFYLAPHWFNIPLVILSTFATVIASQAGISGGFSLAKQLTQLGYFPRLRILHTNAHEEGQIYVPDVNHALMIGALLLIVSFRSSEALAAAYGIAVTGTFICTTTLSCVVFHKLYKWPAYKVAIIFGIFFCIDIPFFTANALKIPEGGWVPLLLGICLTIMMTSWNKGRNIIIKKRAQDAMPIASFLARLPQGKITRVSGTAIFMTPDPMSIPNSLIHNLRHNKVLHDHVLFVTIENLKQPEAEYGHRIAMRQLAPNIYQIIVRYGFMEMPNLPKVLELLKSQPQLDFFDPLQASYFTTREQIVPASIPKMSKWRMAIFMFMNRNASPVTDFLRIPADRVVELAVRVSI
ncbi:K+ uptake protein Kup (Kup) [Commensalibacter communis]|uniref:Probable potassium transport system protein Kup n=2 Tax=Commensalibacter communis TaxID=2972786 RepID=A0A9W4TQJ3_9PROT|nr:K+ uptake protein Kup (Kup) [Commensalibacter communis]CAI3950655.1 K+ uptake protein Kup (Kup) [Commensalibacter communis]CAI3951404.1 K+ uptake protein Kup (Kup) [Commensalibacter communis]CAI3955839.1 K+ uptake protein Kup (Kup) [Commensalibacter communis]CAI3957543.1 K+ uptake protein Kup (Kup) [Commensalibacter communis]